MTWDVYAVRARGVRNVEDLPAGFEPPPIGSPEEVLGRIREAAPHVQDNGSGWLRMQGPDHCVDINIGKSFQVHQVDFGIEVGGDPAPSVAKVLEVCRVLKVTPYDTEAGSVLTEQSAPAEPPPPSADEESGGRWWQKLLRR